MRENRPILVCLTGMDGTGKTTVAKRLVDHLNGTWGPAEYVYGRYQPVTVRVAWALARPLVGRSSRAEGDYHDYRDRKRGVLQRFGMPALYQRWLLGEYALQLWANVGRRLRSGTSVVCDRYLYDTAIMEIGVELGFSDQTLVELVEKWLNRVPRPDVTIVMDVTPEIAMERKDDVPHVDYLEEVRGIYLALAEAHELPVVDTNQSLDRVTEAAVGLMDDRLVGQGP